MTEKKIPNAADKNSISEEEMKGRNKQKQDYDDLKFLLTHPQFRRFIFSILKNIDPDVERSVLGSISSNELFYMTGVQDVGRRIKTKINSADPDALCKLMKEGNRNAT